MSKRNLIMEQYSDEIELFKLASSYHKKNGLEMTLKVLSKIINTIQKRETPSKAPKDTQATLSSDIVEVKKKQK